MDWIKGMNQAIKYIEENLENTIDLEEVSRQAFSSSFHFQRLFHVLTEMTVTEYIRKRRLTLAVKDLAQNDEKVIDVALRYGYETPEAFSKAFKRQHGANPSEVKKGNFAVKATLPLQIHVTLKGADMMEYRIEKKAGMRFIGLKKEITTVDGENFNIIPKFWNDFFQMPLSEKMMAQSGDLGIIGACYNNNDAKEIFDYMIGVEYDRSLEGQDLEVLEIPDARWAVFPVRGPIPTAMQEVWQRIFNEFFPGSDYEHAMLPELEVYSKGDVSASDYYSEIWIPIKED